MLAVGRGVSRYSSVVASEYPLEIELDAQLEVQLTELDIIRGEIVQGAENHICCDDVHHIFVTRKYLNIFFKMFWIHGCRQKTMNIE